MPVDILIVDDSAAIRRILQRMLVRASVPLGKVVEAGDGVEALEALKKTKVNLVLSDINMPNMDGLQLLRNIRANDEAVQFLLDLFGREGLSEWNRIPVIMITTEGGEAKVMEAVQLGANGYVLV
ncbi:MAG: response regulator [Bryobacteraceae bacterium]